VSKNNKRKDKESTSPAVDNDQLGENAPGIDIQNEEYKKNHSNMSKKK